MNLNNTKILIGASGKSFETSVKNLFEQEGVEVDECSDGIEVIRKSFLESPDLIILDVEVPGLNGYQCSRVLKGDPFMEYIPIILMGSAEEPIDRFWAAASGGNYYLHRPINAGELEEILRSFVNGKSGKNPVFAPARIQADLSDHSIMTMANDIMERKLIRSEIMNEISLIETSDFSMKELITAIMNIVGSLYDFSLGLVMFFHDEQGELFFYKSGEMDQKHLESIKSLLLQHLKERHEIYLHPKQINFKLIEADRLEGSSVEIEDLYIHTRRIRGINCVLAFQNIGFDKLGKNEQETLLSVLDHAQGVLEKKLFFEISQKLSIIDTVTQDASLAFFMACLSSEIEKVERYDYPIAIFTISFSNLDEITRDFKTDKTHSLIRHINRLILSVSRKSDIVARYDPTSFAFLLTHIDLEQARMVQNRIHKQIMSNLSRNLPPSVELKTVMGICQFDPERDRTPEIFLENSKPQGPPRGVSNEKPLSEEEVEKVSSDEPQLNAGKMRVLDKILEEPATQPDVKDERSIPPQKEYKKKRLDDLIQ